MTSARAAEQRQAAAPQGLVRTLLPNSLRNRLALVFLTITLVVVVVIYVFVAPSLGSSLRDEKLRSLAGASEAYSVPLEMTVGSRATPAVEAHAVRQAAALSGARVTLLGVSSGTLGVGTYFIADSSTLRSAATARPVGGDLQFGVAADAARLRRTLTTTEVGTAGRVGEAAKPLFYRGAVARVVVFSGPLNDVQRSVALIRRRILVAGAIALLVAMLAGYLVARHLSQRVGRLEQAARRVAAGDFSARFPIDSQDELGQLARALDDMQRQLAELDSARERFIATASHELRTPIFSLGGFLELIQDEELDEETRLQFIGQLRAQVDRLGKLATGLLDLSRLESGALELHTEPSDLAAIARTVTSEFTPSLAQHSAHLRLRLAQEPIPAVCDPERVAQVLRILIDNAIVHTPQGTNIVVTASRSDRSARLAVRDFGEGIKPSAMSRIFEPFYTSDGVQGAGMGLAIARELAERMRGRLGVESAPGRTVFTLDLPA